MRSQQRQQPLLLAHCLSCVYRLIEERINSRWAQWEENSSIMSQEHYVIQITNQSIKLFEQTTKHSSVVRILDRSPFTDSKCLIDVIFRAEFDHTRLLASGGLDHAIGSWIECVWCRLSHCLWSSCDDRAVTIDQTNNRMKRNGKQNCIFLWCIIGNFT